MLFLILDIRREPSREDLLIAGWAAAKQMPLFVIFTKKDKLSETEVEKAVAANLAKLAPFPMVGFLAMSNQQFYERKHFIQRINKEMAAWG